MQLLPSKETLKSHHPALAAAMLTVLGSAFVYYKRKDIEKYFSQKTFDNEY